MLREICNALVQLLFLLYVLVTYIFYWVKQSGGYYPAQPCCCCGHYRCVNSGPAWYSFITDALYTQAALK